jgi:alanine or glycine:cation symporter, AGCS family
VRIIKPFRIAWCVAVFVGATVELALVWLLADTLNALMAIPNLIALAMLSPVVFALSREFFKTRGKSENNPF